MLGVHIQSSSTLSDVYKQLTSMCVCGGERVLQIKNSSNFWRFFF